MPSTWPVIPKYSHCPCTRPRINIHDLCVNYYTLFLPPSSSTLSLLLSFSISLPLSLPLIFYVSSILFRYLLFFYLFHSITFEMKRRTWSVPGLGVWTWLKIGAAVNFELGMPCLGHDKIVSLPFAVNFIVLDLGSVF